MTHHMIYREEFIEEPSKLDVPVTTVWWGEEGMEINVGGQRAMLVSIERLIEGLGKCLGKRRAEEYWKGVEDGTES